jgi:hypothetical protein
MEATCFIWVKMAIVGVIRPVSTGCAGHFVLHLSMLCCVVLFATLLSVDFAFLLFACFVLRAVCFVPADCAAADYCAAHWPEHCGGLRYGAEHWEPLRDVANKRGVHDELGKL